MALFSGKNGQVKFNNVVLIGDVNQVTDWTLSTSCATAECTTMGNDWKRRLPGFNNAEASVSCVWVTETDPSSLKGGNFSLELYLDDTHYFEANFVCTNLTIALDKEDVARATFSFVLNDTAGITYN